MADDFEIKHVVKLWVPDEGGTWAEVPGLVEVRTTDKASKDYFGNLSLVLSPTKAKALAEALRTVAETINA